MERELNAFAIDRLIISGFIATVTAKVISLR